MRMPKGKYTVKVGVDTGPLAGFLTGSNDAILTGAWVSVDYWTAWRPQLVVSSACVLFLLGTLVVIRIRRKNREVKFQ